jgi:hypothetical protein
MIEFISIFVVCWFSSCSYFVANNGSNNENCGGETNECATIEKLIQGKNETMNIILRNGIYVEVCN